MYEQSHRDYSNGYLHHRLPVIANHYRDNAITYKAQRDKNARELKLANAAITDMQMRQRDVAALDAGKYTKELADAKAGADALRDDAAGRRRLSAVCQSCVKARSPPAWIMQPPPDWQTPLLNGIISPQREKHTMQKQLEGTRRDTS